MTYKSHFRARQAPAIATATALVLLGLAWVTAAGIAGTAAKPVLTYSWIGGYWTNPTRAAYMIPTHAGLIHMNADGSYAPLLATSWRYIKPKARSGRANKDFEFTLRKDARFSDGTPVTAQAVVGWFEYFLKSSSVYVPLLGAGATFEAVGRWTVRIHLKSPNPVLPFVLSDQGMWGAISSPAAVANPTLMDERTYGAGPYMVDSGQTVSGDHWTLVPNPYYYDRSKIKWSKIVIKTIPSVTSQLQALQAGQIDVTAGNFTTAGEAARTGFSVVRAPFGTAGFIFRDVSGAFSKPLADVRVRQAMNYAIDRRTMLNAITGGYGQATAAFPCPDCAFQKYANSYPYNPSRAKSLLAAAGYPDGFTLDVYGYATSGFPPLRELAQAAAKYWGDIGIEVKLDVSNSGAAWFQKLNSTNAPLVELWTAYFRSMYLQFPFVWKPGSTWNSLTGWNDAVVNKLWVQGARSNAPEKYWKKIQERITSQAYFVPLMVVDNVMLVSKKVKGVAPSRFRAYPDPTDWSPA